MYMKRDLYVRIIYETYVCEKKLHTRPIEMKRDLCMRLMRHIYFPPKMCDIHLRSRVGKFFQ